MQDVIKKGDIRFERLFQLWKDDKKDAGWLIIGSESYRVIANDDDDVLFIPARDGIDNYYGTITGGIPQ